MVPYFGKFSREHPEQIAERFYAGGPIGNGWYGGIKPDDYVFPIFEGKIDRLWKVREYGLKDNKVDPSDQGVIFFDEIKTFSPVNLASEFSRYRYFELDLTLLNKSTKSVKGCGFFPISTSPSCPEPENIIFSSNSYRSIYVTTPKLNLDWQERDIRIVVDPHTDKIENIEIWEGGQFQRYRPLWDLYEEKNIPSQRYSLKELLNYAVQDGASKKEPYLRSLLNDLNSGDKFVVTSPIALYDNVLVGRKKYFPPNARKTKGEQIDEEELEAVSEELSQYEKFAKILDFNPNLILYGPPGTGKTYAAMRIVESYERMRTGEVKPFSVIDREEKRVKFVTFHQSYSYEEFIEGIRPDMAAVDVEGQGDSGEIRYRVVPGILRQIAEEAEIQVIKSDVKGSTNLISEKSTIWKVSLGNRGSDDVYKDCISANEIAIGWLDDLDLTGKTFDDIFTLLKQEREKDDPAPMKNANSVNNLVNQMKDGDIVFILNSSTTIRDLGVIKDEYFFKKEAQYYRHRRKVEWLKHFDPPLDIFEMNGRKTLVQQTIYELSRVNYADIREILKENSDAPREVDIIPYYLIIDEINRGNISKIFGELITLIEKDKRGQVKCWLPYSRKGFSLPSNIYIIGTMNTADRSIAVLDTALRRRFAFLELEPDVTVFDNPNIAASPKVNDRVDIRALLTSINRIIVDKLDRDHRIGHAYFINVAGLQDLYNTWYYKVLPLLMEYFYSDAASVRDIVGKDFLNNDGSINFLSLKPEGDGVSLFEKRLMSIYSE